MFKWFTSLAPLWLVVYLFHLSFPGILFIDPTNSVVISWLFLQCYLVAFIIRQFKAIPWNKVEEIDLAIAVICGLVFASISGSVAVDLLPVNYVSRIHHTSNVLSVFECDSIVNAAEQHARENLERTLMSNTSDGSTDKLNSLLVSGGWLTDRHANYPTTDISAYTINQNINISSFDTNKSERAGEIEYDFVTWMNHTIANRVLPHLRRQYNLHDFPGLEPQLSMKDLFIVKYDADNPLAQRHLELHTDSSQLSFNIALNERDSSALSELPSAHLDSPGQCHTEVERTEITSAHVNSENPGEASAIPTIETGGTYRGGGTYFMRSGDTLHIQKGDMLSHPSRIYHAGSEVTKGKKRKTQKNVLCIRRIDDLCLSMRLRSFPFWSRAYTCEFLYFVPFCSVLFSFRLTETILHFAFCVLVLYITGKRYILVGFVNVRPRGLGALYRRFGMFSRCVGVITETIGLDGMYVCYNSMTFMTVLCLHLFVLLQSIIIIVGVYLLFLLFFFLFNRLNV